ncbi:MAG: PDZ domain-containing protein [Sulfurimonas sp.]|nr:PDZ domain-containing protein [Sulfurimonas sp.]
MKKISNPMYILLFTKLLVLLIIAKGISMAIYLYLPSDGVELNIKSNYQPKYQRVDFKNMISKINILVEKSITQEQVGVSITNMILKGLYGTKSKGYIIVAMKSNLKETAILGIGENYQGYLLKSISSSSAMFEKDGAKFVLDIEGSRKIKNIIDRKVYTKSNIAKEDISYYAKNPKEIFKEISISENKDGKNPKGFKVTKVNKNSKIYALGLRVGDVIIKVNNVTLNSYKDALGIYENIDKLDMMQIVLMRNNQEVELVYEIN